MVVQDAVSTDGQEDMMSVFDDAKDLADSAGKKLSQAADDAKEKVSDVADELKAKANVKKAEVEADSTKVKNDAKKALRDE